MADGAPPRAVVEITGARVTFRERQVLKGVSLAMRGGEVLVLLGPNGAGKSTLIRVLSGRLAPDSGSVLIEGLSPAKDARARARIGIVPQRIALFDKLSAEENLVAFARLMGLGRRDVPAAVSAVLARVGLADRARDRVSALSGGMQRRVNIAAALLHQPHVLVLDEPTAGLDMASQASLVALLRELRDEGLSVLLTTHDMDEAEALADRVVVLLAGEIRAEGTPRELIDRAFGSRRELTLKVQLGAMTRSGARVKAVLEEAGLTAGSDGRTWTGFVEGSDGSLAELVSTAVASGGVVEDVRVRRPGLGALLGRLAALRGVRR